MTTNDNKSTDNKSTDNKSNDITIATHLYIAIATTCLAYLLVVFPITSVFKENFTTLIKYSPVWTMTLILYIILPGIIIHRGLYKFSESGEDNFALMKMFAVIITGLGRELFLAYFVLSGNVSKNSKFYTLFTIFMLITLGGNIAEAVYNQISDRNKPELDNTTEVPELNIINASMGIILIIVLLIIVFKGHKIGVNNTSGNLYQITKIGYPFIIAYTLWNLLFVIQTGGIPTFMFFCTTLLLPIILEFCGVGDWLHTRGVTLMFFIIVMFGIGKGQENILPMYNNLDNRGIGTDFKDSLQLFQENKELKIFLLTMTCLSTVGSLFYYSSSYFVPHKIM